METFEEFAGRWLNEAIHLRPSSSAKYAGHLRTHLIPAFGDRALDDLRPSNIKSWLASLHRSGASVGTTRTCFRTLHTILATAVTDQVLDRNPCAGIRLPREDDGKREMLFLSAEEIERLADAIDPRYRALIYVAAYSGCRWGELAYLRRDHIHVLSGQLNIKGSLSEVSGRLIEQGTKSGRHRTVTLPRSVAQLLGEHIGAFPGRDGFVFTSPAGHPLRRRNWYPRFFKPAVEKAGLNPGLRFHDLRHTHAALLIASGTHVRVISDRLGHAKPSFTLDQYSHVLPSLEETAVAGLEAMFNGKASAQA